MRGKSIILFALEIILNFVIFCIKVIFGKRELLVPVDLSKSSFEKFAHGKLLEAAKRKVFALTPSCPLLFNTCLAEILRNLRILQRRGGILSRPYRLFWSSKYFTPFRTVMSTPGSRCKPPANKIVEPLTFTTGKMEIRGKVVLSQ